MNKREREKRIRENEKRIRELERALIHSEVQKVLDRQSPHPLGHLFVWVNGECMGYTCTNDPHGCEDAIRAIEGVRNVWLCSD